MDFLKDVLGIVASFIPISEHRNFVLSSKHFNILYHKVHPKLQPINELNALVKKRSEHTNLIVPYNFKISIEVLCVYLWFSGYTQTEKFYPEDKFTKEVRSWFGLDNYINS